MGGCNERELDEVAGGQKQKINSCEKVQWGGVQTQQAATTIAATTVEASLNN